MSSRAPTTDARYTRVAVLFHWTLAVLLVGLLISGVVMHKEGVPNRFAIYPWHKSFGILVLFLSLGRLGWRLGHRPPPEPPGMPGWQVTASKATHWAFYALMIGMPLLGWAMVSASPLPIPTVLFDVVPWPDLPLPEGEAQVGMWKNLHSIGAKLFIALLVLHVAAALKHQFIDRDGLLSRMRLRRG